jgi:hypothetical protein
MYIVYSLSLSLSLSLHTHTHTHTSKPLVTIASLKFHARALTSREVEDMFKNGQLLVEVATGKGPNVVQVNKKMRAGKT